MKAFKTGLVVGKFCPLHKGHEYLIDTALEACERLILISYAKPGYVGCEVEKRRAWLKALYPQTTRLVIDDAWWVQNGCASEFPYVPHDDADEDIHRRFTAELCHSFLGETVDAIFTSEDYGDGFAQVVSDIQSVPAKHICVDKARQVVPISGTRIREDVGQFRAYLSDSVYASFIKRAVFLGGESTGKSTLTQLLATRFGTEFAAEYGRELWEQKNGVLAFEDMLHIAHVQTERERKRAVRSTGWLFCDTSPLTTAFYSQEMFGKLNPALEALSHRAYDMTFLCAPDFDFVQDGTRQGSAFRDRQHAWYVKHLTDRNIDFIELSGSIETRIKTVLDCLANQP